MYVVSLKRAAERELERLPTQVHERIVERLLTLKEDPRPVGVRKLRGREGYRIRSGNCRVLYLIDDKRKVVEILSVAHHRDVYR